MIFQTPNYWWNRTVADNIALPLIISDLNNKKYKAAFVQFLLESACITKEKYFPYELSTAKQRVSIARAIVNKPALLLVMNQRKFRSRIAKIMTLFDRFNN